MVFVPAFGKREEFAMKNSVAVVKQEADKNFHKIEINKVYSKDIDSYGVELLVDCDINNPFQGGSEMSWFSTKEEQEEEFNKLLKENGMTKCKLSDIEYWEDVTHFYNIFENGDPNYETEHTDGDFRCYHCSNCDEEFKTFEEVKEHING